MAGSLTLKEVLNSTLCQDNPRLFACDMRAGYFSFLSDSAWKAGRINLLTLPKEMRFIEMYPWHVIMVPAEGWSASAKSELPFHPPGAQLVCPEHALARFRNLVRANKTDDLQDLIWSLRSAFSAERAKELATSEPAHHGGRDPLEIIKASMRANTKRGSSISEANLKELKKIGGTPEEQGRLWKLVEAAKFEKVEFIGERREKMDEALRFAWQLLRRGTRSKAASYRILGTGLYWIFHQLTDALGQQRDMESTVHKRAIERFVARVKRRLLRLESSEKESTGRRRGRSFKKSRRSRERGEGTSKSRS